MLLAMQSDGEEPTSPVEEVAAADEVEVSGDAAASGGGSMSVLDALKGEFFTYNTVPNTEEIDSRHIFSQMLPVTSR